jgi:hypothetical protein
MLISDAFPSEYLKAADLRGKQVRVVIDRIELREVGDDQKPVLFFHGKDKGVVLNKTNANNIGVAYGDDTDEWTGKEVILYEAIVDFQGRSVKAIRIRLPSAKEGSAAPLRSLGQAVPRPRESENPGHGVEDEIPF